MRFRHLAWPFAAAFFSSTAAHAMPCKDFPRAQMRPESDDLQAYADHFCQTGGCWYSWGCEGARAANIRRRPGSLTEVDATCYSQGAVPDIETNGSDWHSNVTFNFFAFWCGDHPATSFQCEGPDTFPYRCAELSRSSRNGEMACGDPVDPATGRVFETETDVSLPGGLSFERTYVSPGGIRSGGGSLQVGTWSYGVRSEISVMTAYSNVPIPRGEDCTWNRDTKQLLCTLDYDWGFKFFRGELQLRRGDGRELSFHGGPTAGWWGAANNTGRITSSPDLKTLYFLNVEEGVIEVYESNTSPYTSYVRTKVTSLDGRTISLVPAGAGSALEDDFGRRLTFPPDDRAAIAQSTVDPDGNVTTYDYAPGFLRRVMHPDGTIREYRYDEPSGITDPKLKGVLTSIVDENGAVTASFTYSSDGGGYALSTASGANPPHRFSYQAVSWASFVGSQTTQITTPLGAAYRLEIPTRFGAYGANDASRVFQPAAGSSPAAVTFMERDDNGNLTQLDDYNGNRTCYSNDFGRNLELVRVEGVVDVHYTVPDCPPLLVPGAPLLAGHRKTTTAWHPTWKLKTREASPGMIRTWVYNGQPDPFAADGSVARCAPETALLPDGSPIVVLCSFVEQSTSDASGGLGFAAEVRATRTTKLTYNGLGQLLTETNPRGFTTTRVYYADTTDEHTRGDLASVTNPLGFATRYTKYDRSGHVLTAVAPNLVTTSYTYTPRGRVQSIAVSDGTSTETTRFTYDGVPQLRHVDMPDGTSVTYTYDEAHRLRGVSDGLGNTISYTLDAMGSLTFVSAKGAGDVLLGHVAMVRDVLGRVQSISVPREPVPAPPPAPPPPTAPAPPTPPAPPPPDVDAGAPSPPAPATP